MRELQTGTSASLHVALLLACLATACTSTTKRLGHDYRLYEWRDRHEDLQRAEETPAFGAGTSLDELLQHAQLANPDLRAAFERWRAALERVPVAGKLPEPRVTFGAYLAHVETRVGPMRGRVGVSQSLPWIGERDLKSRTALAAAALAREMVEAARVEVVAALLDAWFEATWLERAIAITAAHRELLLSWEEVARTRLETGIGSNADVIRAQVELGEIENRLLSLEDLRRPIRARINAALDRPLGAELPAATGPLPPPPAIDGERLAAELDRTSPGLRALDHRIVAARWGVELAGTAFYPDFVLGVDYTVIGEASGAGVSGSGRDAVAATIGLALPIWRSTYKAGLREAEALEKAARLEHASASNRLELQLETALYRFRDGSRRVELLLNTLIPKGEEAVAALDASYRSGDRGFLDLVDAERMVLELQLQAVRAEADRAQAVAEIERITGVALTAHGSENRQ